MCLWRVCIQDAQLADGVSPDPLRDASGLVKIHHQHEKPTVRAWTASHSCGDWILWASSRTAICGLETSKITLSGRWPSAARPALLCQFLTSPVNHRVAWLRWAKGFQHGSLPTLLNNCFVAARACTQSVISDSIPTNRAGGFPSRHTFSSIWFL